MATSRNETPSFELMRFEPWRREISPLWEKENAVDSIYSFLNGFGQVQYVGRELFSSMLVFPIAAVLQGRRVGWTSCYNISDSAIRIRGIYVLPEYRRRGIGRALATYAMSLWPQPWQQCFMYARESNLARYVDDWGFEVAPGHSLRTFPWGKAVGEKRIVLVRKAIHHATPSPAPG